MIIQLFLFFKDYNDWIYLQNKIDIPEVRYILVRKVFLLI